MIRAGIIGFGGHGRGHFRRLNDMEGVQVTAVYDVDPQVPRHWFQQQEPTPSPPLIVDDMEGLWDHVDAVWVTTPPGFHYENTMAALEAGKHVFCEKPIALRLDHADDMAALAQEKDLCFSVGYCLRFQPLFSELRRLAQEKQIGELASLWCTRIGPFGYGPDHWRTRGSVSGGVMLEVFTHNIDWLRFVGGEVRRVFMHDRTIQSGLDCTDHAMGLLEFRSGAVGRFYTSWASARKRYEWGIDGSQGVAVPQGRSTIKIMRLDGSEEELDVGRVDHTEIEDRRFIAAVAGRGPLPLPAAEAVATLEVHAALHLSALSGTPVHLPLEDRAVPAARTDSAPGVNSV